MKKSLISAVTEWRRNLVTESWRQIGRLDASFRFSHSILIMLTYQFESIDDMTCVDLLRNYYLSEHYKYVVVKHSLKSAVTGWRRKGDRTIETDR